MGEVWRAVDTKLGRSVAIKTLPREFVGDPERLGRFEREARLLASLHHPNIAAIHGIEEADGIRFLVMELAEGEDLSQRIERGAVPLDDAIRIATAIAEALEAAHEKGIVHRDLKPGNVRVTAEGRVTLLDFGLGKNVDGDASSPDLTNSPTIARAATAAGIILGTAAYMSPEQARGKHVDRRADIWAFGVVLWEMLTGRRLFAGETVSDTLAAVLTTPIDFDAVPRETPPNVRWVLRRCLERDPKQRLRDIGDARIALTSAESTTLITSSIAPLRERAWPRLLGYAAIVAAVGLAGYLGYLRGSARPLRKTDIGVDIGGVQDIAPQLSPDGTALLLPSQGGLAIRELQDVALRPITGAEHADYACWSPDSREIAFVTQFKLWRTTRDGKQPVLISAVPQDLAGSGGIVWLPNDTIVMAGSDRSGLLEVPARGGALREIEKLDLKKERDLHEISAFPGGRGMMFTVHPLGGRVNRIDAWVNGARKNLFTIDDGSDLEGPVWSSTGHIVFTKLHEGSVEIWALPFSLRTMSAAGAPFRIAPGSQPSASNDGTLTYLRGNHMRDRQLLRVDRSGHIEAEMSRPALEIRDPSMSPDGRKIAACVAGKGRSFDIVVFDTETRTMERLVTTTDSNWEPAFSPDGKTIVWSIVTRNIISTMPANGGPATKLCDGFLPRWWPDGKSIVLSRLDASGSYGVWRHWLDGRDEALLTGPANEWKPEPSPDGKLLAYVSEESGRPELFVREIGGEGRTMQLSSTGVQGLLRWSRNGEEIIYRSGDAFYAVRRSDTPRISFGTPQQLFTARDAGISRFDVGFDVTPDNRGIIVTRDIADDVNRATLTLVTNWMSEFAK